MYNMTSKDALWALETTMEEDMKSYGNETTNLVIKHINSTPKLYKKVKEDGGVTANIAHTCINWAKQHNDEFGDLFITELDIVDWAKVKRMV